MTRRKMITLLASSLVLTSSIAVAGVTYAKYATTDLAEQTIYTEGGHVKTSVFLDCDGVWNQGYSELFYAHFWDKDDASVATGPILPSKMVTITMTGYQTATRTLYVYEMDTTLYDSLLFVRANPNPTNEVGSNNWWNLSNNDIWGRTDDIKTTNSIDIPGDYNYFLVTGYRTDSKYCNCTWKKINSSGYVAP